MGPSSLPICAPKGRDEVVVYGAWARLKSKAGLDVQEPCVSLMYGPYVAVCGPFLLQGPVLASFGPIGPRARLASFGPVGPHVPLGPITGSTFGLIGTIAGACGPFG